MHAKGGGGQITMASTKTLDPQLTQKDGYLNAAHVHQKNSVKTNMAHGR